MIFVVAPVKVSVSSIIISTLDEMESCVSLYWAMIATDELYSECLEKYDTAMYL